MYLRAVHAEPDIPTLRAFVRENPFGILTTAIDSPSGSFPLLQSTHVPWHFEVYDPESPTELGTLRGHLARANPHSKAIIESLNAAADPEAVGVGKLTRDVMVLFTAPAQHYVTPKWYVETKPASGKVVPTWNYAAVQAYGRATVYYSSADARTSAFLDRHLRALSQFAEGEIMEHEEPWTVDDAPESYVELLKKAIIGIEVEVTQLAGKWKMSQEMSPGDREGVVAGFEAMGSDVGKCIAGMVKERAKISESRKQKSATATG